MRWLALVLVPALACGAPSKETSAPLASTVAPPMVKASPPRFKPRSAPNLLPRNALFSDPERTAPRISPDGTRIGFGATVKASSTLFIGPIDDLEKAKPVRMKTLGQIHQWFFSYLPGYFVYVIDRHGTEDNKPYALAIDTNETIDLMPPGCVSAEIAGQSARRPNEIVLGASKKGGEAIDLYVVDIRTGKSTLLYDNKERFIDFDLDADFVPRIGTKLTESGAKEVRSLAPDGSSKLLFKLEPEDQLTTTTVGLSDHGKTLYLRDSRGRNTTALVALDLATSTTTVVASDDKADIVGVLRDPKTGKPQAYSSDPGKSAWHAVDDAFAKDLAEIKDENHIVDIVNRSKDDTKWVLLRRAPNEPNAWLLYDRTKKEKKFLFVDRPELAKYPLSPMEVVQIKTRDGLDLVGYLTLPPKVDEKLPLVLWVHGGPWDRDHWELNPFHQLFANRGYAVLTVNFRGSTGFGKKLVNAGNREWGGKMQDDLVDAVAWAVERKIADPTRVAIFGGSYGGYATLVGLSRDPDRFACGIDLVGPSNLVTFVESIPPIWRPLLGQFHSRVGDPSTEAGKRDLLARSPLTRADAIRAPVLVVQGKNDPRVKERESAQMVDALVARKVPVTYLLYENEGHGFSHDENVRSFSAVAEVFLSQCLGGVYEPFGDALEGSSIRAVVGGEHISGLAAAALK